MSESKSIGDPCPKCSNALIRRLNSFHWRGEFFDGAVCEQCNALWAIKGEEMPPLKPAVKKEQRE